MKNIGYKLGLFVLAWFLAMQSEARAATNAVLPQVTAGSEYLLSAKSIKQFQQEQKDLRGKLEELTDKISEYRKNQARITDDLSDFRQQTEEMRAQVVGFQNTVSTMNQLLIAADELAAVSQASLDQQEKSLQQLRAQNPASAAQLQEQVLREQKKREEMESLLKQRDDEVQKLRKMLEERDALLKKQSTTANRPAAPSAVNSSPAKVAEPGVQILPAVSNKPAVAIIQSMVKPAGPSAIEMVTDGNRRLREGKIAEAKDLFAKALESEPKMMGARLGLAACYYTQGNTAEAKKMVQNLLAEDRSNPQGLGLLGLIYWREGDVRAAADSLQRAIRLNPDDAQLHNYMGIIMNERGDRDRAIQELSKAIELNADLAEAHFNLAVVLATAPTPRLDEAREHYLLALKLGNAPDANMDELLKPGVSSSTQKSGVTGYENRME